MDKGLKKCYRCIDGVLVSDIGVLVFILGVVGVISALLFLDNPARGEKVILFIIVAILGIIMMSGDSGDKPGV